MMFKLDSLEISHFIFVALAEYSEVKIGNAGSLPNKVILCIGSL